MVLHTLAQPVATADFLLLFSKATFVSFNVYRKRRTHNRAHLRVSR